MQSKSLFEATILVNFGRNLRNIAGKRSSALSETIYTDRIWNKMDIDKIIKFLDGRYVVIIELAIWKERLPPLHREGRFHASENWEPSKSWYNVENG